MESCATIYIFIHQQLVCHAFETPFDVIYILVHILYIFICEAIKISEKLIKFTNKKNKFNFIFSSSAEAKR